MLPWLHTYDIILGEAVLQQPHPEEWTTFQHTQSEQEITKNSDILHTQKAVWLTVVPRWKSSLPLPGGCFAPSRKGLEKQVVCIVCFWSVTSDHCTKRAGYHNAIVTVSEEPCLITHARSTSKKPVASKNRNTNKNKEKYIWVCEHYATLNCISSTSFISFLHKIALSNALMCLTNLLTQVAFECTNCLCERQYDCDSVQVGHVCCMIAPCPWSAVNGDTKPTTPTH